MGCQRQIACQVSQAGADFKDFVGRFDIRGADDFLQGMSILEKILSQAFMRTQPELVQKGRNIQGWERESVHGKTVTKLVGTGARKYTVSMPETGW